MKKFLMTSIGVLFLNASLSHAALDPDNLLLDKDTSSYRPVSILVPEVETWDSVVESRSYIPTGEMPEVIATKIAAFL